MLQPDDWQNNCDCEDDQYLDDGKKSHKFIWTITIILALIGFCNLVLNLSILIVLRITQGMESIEIIIEKDLIKFSGDTDLDRIRLQRDICEGFGDEPIELIGDSGGVQIQVANRHHSMSNFLILENGTSISKVNSFQVRNPKGGSPIFSTDFPNFNLVKSVKKMEADIVQTHRIIAPKKSDLDITSDISITLHGAEGTTLDSKEITFAAKNDILLSSRNGDIIIDAKDGVIIPKLPKTSEFSSEEMQEQYKVCICMPSGKLFTVPVQKGNTNTNCEKISNTMNIHPCTM